MLRNSGQVLSS